MRYSTKNAAWAVILLGVALAVASGRARADEGMWTPQQVPAIAAALTRAGLELDPAQLADPTGDPLGAVVSLGGCTASFVSPNGLVLTNHHCAYGALQLNSTAERNLVETGFNAATLADEVSAGGNARIYVLDSIRDVTEPVRAAIRAAPDALARTRALEAVEKKLVAECEREPGYRCRLYSFAGGNRYRLFRNLEIRDVRLVYAPPRSIGNYGGEIDNWMWPRHSGDFAFYRAYVAPDGSPAGYSPDNVPYRPEHWLTIASEPLRRGDFVMVAGYPGRTSRHALAEVFDQTALWAYPTLAAHYQDLVELVQAAGDQDVEIAVKYASALRGWQNAMKNYRGQLAGFARIGASERKRSAETAVIEWLRSRGAEGEDALAAHRALVLLNAQAREHRARDLVFGQLRRTGAIGAAVQLYRLAIEREKPDAQREPGYQQRDLPELRGALAQMQRRYHPQMDRQLQEYWLREYLQLPESQRIAAIDQWLGGGDDSDQQQALQRALDRLAKTRLDDPQMRKAWLGAGRAEFERSDDPAIQFAVAIMPTVLELERAAKVRAGHALLARPVWLQAVAEYRRSLDEPIYPDANSSLRITFGHVKGYTKPDGSRQPAFTTLEQVAAKATGEFPFDAPDELLEQVAAENYGGLASEALGSVPVNFLADVDITGGNSGSPVLDARGELVGLAFDMNWESVSSNWVFDPAMTRMIALDQRYMRWIMQEVYPAPRLLQEMGVPEDG